MTAHDDPPPSRRCPWCGDARPDHESESEAQAHVIACVKNSDAMNPLLDEGLRQVAAAQAAVRADADVRRLRWIVRRLLEAPARGLDAARLEELLRELGGRDVPLDRVVLMLYRESVRVRLRRLIKRGETGIRSRRVNGRLGVLYGIGDAT